MRYIRTWIAALALLVCCGLASAQTLTIGDPAPALSAGKFVQGEPVKEFEKGKVYIIEFWATWCGPCVAAIPHVNDLQKKYADKGLVVIGQNVWERDESLVEPFIKKMGDKMSYRIAMDEKADANDRGKMAATWMQAAGRNGIPCSFIVNQEGKIAWIGHPMVMDKPLESIIAGEWDMAKAKVELAAEQQTRTLQTEVSKLAQAGKFDEALVKLDELEKLSPSSAKMMIPMRMRLLQQAGKTEQVQALADAALKEKDGQTLMRMASALMAGQNANRELAEKLAAAAVEATGGEDPMALMVMAQLHAANNQFDKAIECQKKALEKAPEQMKPYLERGLKTFEENKAKQGA